MCARCPVMAGIPSKVNSPAFCQVLLGKTSFQTNMLHQLIKRNTWWSFSLVSSSSKKNKMKCRKWMTFVGNVCQITAQVLTPKVESFFHAVTMAIMIVPASSGTSSFPPFYSSLSFPSLLIAAILPLPWLSSRQGFLELCVSCCYVSP